ncbi:importin-11 [Neocloeon triangulifer]|uniref:importin-11 n=1 Tax=Neocloeon triangulifer TaxID=2078957 RepID=UPI00286EDA9A|nr:importin-11 [Neocloeon triangulifer]
MEASHPEVLAALGAATSQDINLLRPAEARLKEWETAPGFYAALLAAFADLGQPVNVRWMAVLCVKNGVDRFWRRNAPNAIDEREKAAVRQSLIACCLQEPAPQILTQLAVLAAKIARHDWPREWPMLMDQLLEGVQRHETRHHALLVLHHVVKTLSSKRLAGDRRLFQELTASLFPHVLHVFEQHMSAQAVNEATLALKILRQMTVHGFKTPYDEPAVRPFLESAIPRTRFLIEMRPNAADQVAIQKLASLLLKLLGDVLEHHPFSYGPLVASTLELIDSLILNDSGCSLLFEKAAVQLLNLLKGILLCPEFKNDTNPAALEAQRAKSGFFSPQLLELLCQRLVGRFLPLSNDELRQWAEDAETFAADEGGECWRYALRPCVESCFVALFKEFRSQMVPPLVQLMQTGLGSETPLLLKEAVYTAVGLVAYDLYDEVDFDSWFKGSLRQELSCKEDNYQIIRRRVAWLLGEWSAVKLSPDLRPLLYTTLLSLLSAGEDMAVRLAAAQALRHSMDDFDFCPEQIEPILGDCFNLLLTLLRDARECDSKMRVLSVATFVVDRVGPAVRPHAVDLVRCLPQLWAEDHPMLRAAVVAALVPLVAALGPDHDHLSTFLLPVVATSTDLDQEAHVYLLEDGLDLWQAVLENAARMSPQLLQLWTRVPTLMERTTEHLQSCLQLTKAYLLLAPTQFLETHGKVLVATLDEILGDIRLEGLLQVLRLVELIMRAEPAAAPLLQVLIERVIMSVLRAEALPILMALQLSVLARLLLGPQNVLADAVNSVAVSSGETADSVLQRLLDVWLDKMSIITQPERRKLLALALVTLLSADDRRFCGLLLAVAEVLNDVQGSQGDTLMLGSIAIEEDTCEEDATEFERRRKRLSLSDPVYLTALSTALQQQLDRLRRQVGQQTWVQLVASVDCETLQQVRQFVSLD